MDELNQHLRASALVMQGDGVGNYPWRANPGARLCARLLLGSIAAGISTYEARHIRPSHYDGAHPYIFMLFSLYLAWGILLVRGAKDP